jgi:hypothetical protein
MQVISMQQIGKHVSTTLGLLLEMVFSIQLMQSGCKEDSWGNPVELRFGSSVELCEGG